MICEQNQLLSAGYAFCIELVIWKRDGESQCGPRRADNRAGS